MADADRKRKVGGGDRDFCDRLGFRLLLDELCLSVSEAEVDALVAASRERCGDDYPRVFRIHRALGRWSRGDGEDDDARAASLEATKQAAERRDELRFLDALPASERYRREWVDFTVFFDWLVSNFASPGGAADVGDRGSAACR